MNLQQFASPLMAENKFVKASFGGFAGSGKTRTATEFITGCYKDMKIEKPLLLIDNEKGSRFLIPIFKQAGIEVYAKQTVYVADVLEAFQLLNRGEVGFLFIDTLTKVWYQYVRDYRAKNRITFMTLQDWGKILPAWQEEFSDKFVDLNGNCVFTGRGGFQYEKEEDTTDENGKVIKKGQFVKSGVKMKLAGETPFEPDINVWMELQQEIDANGLRQWREAQILKDRSGLIDGKVFKDPTYADFQPVIKFLCNVEVGKVSKATDKTNLAPGENYAKYEEKQLKVIEHEKIQALFDLQKFSGQSKDDKAMKVTIIKKFFGTTSETEIERLSLADLQNTRKELELFFNEFKNDRSMEFINNYQTETEKDIADPNDPLGLAKNDGHK